MGRPACGGHPIVSPRQQEEDRPARADSLLGMRDAGRMKFDPACRRLDAPASDVHGNGAIGDQHEFMVRVVPMARHDPPWWHPTEIGSMDESMAHGSTICQMIVSSSHEHMLIRW
jgi:hypothetical protein